VHGARQSVIERPKSRHCWTGAEHWWDCYLEDPEFRYREELPAHAAEFRAQMPHDRNDRAKLLISTAQRLIAPLYNYGIKSLNQAIKDLRNEIEHASARS
jgi:hypothetical protein